MEEIEIIRTIVNPDGSIHGVMRHPPAQPGGPLKFEKADKTS